MSTTPDSAAGELRRLPDLTFRWRPFPEVMESMDWYGVEHWGPCYGNFWMPLACRLLPHRWSEPLKVTDTESGWPRIVRRCQRCGSQIHTAPTVEPPKRGRL